MKLDPSIDIDVLPEVYNPGDDSFLLLECVEVRPGERFLEVGCGAGLVALHAAKFGAEVHALDINPSAVECTRRNAAKNRLRVAAHVSDLFEKVTGNFDNIAFNPPYLPQEGTTTSWIERSWSGGREGCEVAVRFLDEAWRHLAPGGRIYIILSSLGSIMTVLKTARLRYELEMLAEKHMFFESVYAYRLRLRSSQF